MERFIFKMITLSSRAVLQQNGFLFSLQSFRRQRFSFRHRIHLKEMYTIRKSNVFERMIEEVCFGLVGLDFLNGLESSARWASPLWVQCWECFIFASRSEIYPGDKTWRNIMDTKKDVPAKWEVCSALHRQKRLVRQKT